MTRDEAILRLNLAGCQRPAEAEITAMMDAGKPIDMPADELAVLRVAMEAERDFPPAFSLRTSPAFQFGLACYRAALADQGGRTIPAALLRFTQEIGAPIPRVIFNNASGNLLTGLEFTRESIIGASLPCGATVVEAKFVELGLGNPGFDVRFDRDFQDHLQRTRFKGAWFTFKASGEHCRGVIASLSKVA